MTISNIKYKLFVIGLKYSDDKVGMISILFRISNLCNRDKHMSYVGFVTIKKIPQL